MAYGSSSGVRLVLILLVVLAIVGVIWYISARNGLVRLDEEIDGAWSEIDNQLQRRADRLQVPDSERLVFAPRYEKLSVRREVHGANRARVAFERGQLFEGVRVPQPHNPIVATGGEQTPIRREPNAEDDATMGDKRCNLGARFHIRDTDLSASIARCKLPTIG